jgi:predicted negative regulator of RcsB-dependent stress response
MAALDLEEQEQMEALKAWWQDNRAWLLGTLAAVAVLMAGWRGWQYYQGSQAQQSAVLYGEFVKQVESKDVKRMNDAAAVVMDKYPSSAYAARAALVAAQLNADAAKDMAQAKTQLQWAIDHAAEEGLKEVARLRLAAVLLDEKNFEGALKLLDAKHQEAYDGLYADLRGDVLTAQGKKEEARTSYKLAYEKTDANNAYRDLIQLKMDALGSGK